MPKLPNQMEKVEWVWYDREEWGKPLFQIPCGENGKTILDTNMQEPGYFKSPESFEMRPRDIEVGLYDSQGNLVPLVHPAWRESILMFELCSKVYWWAPLIYSCAKFTLICFAVDFEKHMKLLSLSGKFKETYTGEVMVKINPLDQFKVEIQSPFVDYPEITPTVFLYGQRLRTL